MNSFKFLGYRISKFNYQINDDYGNQKEPLLRELNISRILDDDNPKYAEIILGINIQSESKSLIISLEIKGGFIASDDMSEKLFNVLCFQNAPAILFPYARSIITSLTAQSNIVPIIMPIVNFVEEYQKNIDKYTSKKTSKNKSKPKKKTTVKKKKG